MSIQLQDSEPRNDYAEFLELTIIVFSGTPPRSNFILEHSVIQDG